MYIVRNSNSEIVLISTLQADAEAFVSSSHLDGVEYTIEDTAETEYFERQYLAMQDGIGEGQVL